MRELGFSIVEVTGKSNDGGIDGRGLIITTGSFKREARREAIRDGAPPIDLIGGNELAEKLKDLGVKIEMIESVTINHEWFKAM